MNNSQSIPTDKLHLGIELLTMCKALNGDIIYTNFIVDHEAKSDIGFRYTLKMPVVHPNITMDIATA